MLTKEGLKEFTRLYWEEYGVELSRQEATEKANKFLELMKVLLIDQPKK